MGPKKRALVIINPVAGQKNANRHLTAITDTLFNGGYLPTVATTSKTRSGKALVHAYGKSVDLIVCIGGDGTLQEVFSGVIDYCKDTPIGFIGAGTTNDFAKGLGLSTDIASATQNLLTGTPTPLDIGNFGGERFSYIACCGAFASASYSASRQMKNSIGHLAYILECIRTLPELRPIHMRIETDGAVYEDDYIFFAACNTTSIGGVLRLDGHVVDLQDGLLEFLLIKAPKNISELTQVVNNLQTRKYTSSLIHMFHSSHVTVHTKKPVSFSLDGERFSPSRTFTVSVLPHAVKLLVPSETAKALSSTGKSRKSRPRRSNKNEANHPLPCRRRAHDCAQRTQRS